jgi:hypothetical protein
VIEFILSYGKTSRFFIQLESLQATFTKRKQYTRSGGEGFDPCKGDQLMTRVFDNIGELHLESCMS